MGKQKKTSRLSTGNKITLGTLSVLGLVGGWNLIGREVSQPTADDDVVATVGAIDASAVTFATPAPSLRATPWPTIAPLKTSPRLADKPVPTLVVVAVSLGQSDAAVDVAGANMSPALLSLPDVAPLPTLAPLPTMPEYVAPPPAPAPPPQVAAAPAPAPAPPPPSGGAVSEGS